MQLRTRNKIFNKTTAFITLVLFLTSMVFLTDLITPRGFMSALPYSFVIVTALWTNNKKFVAFLTLLCLFLTVIGFYYSPPGEDAHLTIMNWTLSMISVSMTGLLCYFRLRNEERIEEIRQRETALETQLRQSQKLEAVGQLAGGVAHDFNNILQVAFGYLSFVLDELRPGDRFYDELFTIQNSMEKAASLTRQLLAFSRSQVMNPKNIDLNQLIQDILKMVNRVIGEHIELKFIPASNLGIVRVDPGQMEQVLLNLCVNARDAMPDGGNLVIETTNTTLDNRFIESHPWILAGNYVCFTVSDTGCGMDDETRSKIFEPFFTTKPFGKGTGLGLSTVYGIIKQHHGMISVYSEKNLGTVFKIYLPQVEKKIQSTAKEMQEEISGGSETILVAEDDPNIREIIVRILKEKGYRVLSATNGIEAIERLRAHNDRIDLLLSDVMMPKMGGKQLYIEVQAIHPHIRTLFISGFSPDLVRDHFDVSADYALIQKPFTTQALEKKVREVLDAPSKD